MQPKRLPLVMCLFLPFGPNKITGSVGPTFISDNAHVSLLLESYNISRPGITLSKYYNGWCQLTCRRNIDNNIAY